MAAPLPAGTEPGDEGERRERGTQREHLSSSDEDPSHTEHDGESDSPRDGKLCHRRRGDNDEDADEEGVGGVDTSAGGSADDAADSKCEARTIGNKQKRYSTKSIPTAVIIAREAHEESGSPDEEEQEEDMVSAGSYSSNEDLAVTHFQNRFCAVPRIFIYLYIRFPARTRIV